MPAEIKSSSHGRTMVLLLSNPEHRNALGPGMYAAGVEALNTADGSDDVRSVIITGEGAIFSAGGDLNRLEANRHEPPEVQVRSIEGLHSWIEAIRTFQKPVIAAVEGAAAGAGFSLALACDFIVAADDAIFSMAYANLALSPDGGATWNLARMLPRAAASELLLGGERTTAARLRELGVVNRVVPRGEALAEALKLAEALNAKAPNALASIKELLNEAGDAPLPVQLASERDHFVRNLHHVNAGEGIDAFLKRRPATYI